MHVAPTQPDRRLPRPPAGPLAAVLLVLAIGFVALRGGALGGSAIGSAGATPGPGAGSASPAATPSDEPFPSSAASTGGPIVVVPASIDATGSRDVAAALQAVIDGAPDGTTVELPAGARFLLGATLHLDGRNGLVLDGNGASLVTRPATGAGRPVLGISGSTATTIRDLDLVGASTAPGVYQPAREHDHGIAIVGSKNTTLSGLTVERTIGDCVYVADRAGTWSDGVRLVDSRCSGPGRNGVAVVGGQNIDVERTTFSNIGYHVLDLEPNQGPPLEGAADVRFADNTVNAPVSGYVVAADGWGPIDRVTVTGNVLAGLPLRVTVEPAAGSGYRRADFTISNNRSDTLADLAIPLMDFGATDDLTISGNDQPLAKATVLAAVSGSCRVTISANQVGSGQAALIVRPSC